MILTLDESLQYNLESLLKKVQNTHSKFLDVKF